MTITCKNSKKRLLGSIGLLVFAIALLAAGQAVAQKALSQKTKIATGIQFKGGSCQLEKVNLNPMFSPADMKENEKAFMVQFKYKLDIGITDDALSVLYNEGRFTAPDGNSYKAGAAISNDSIYSLVTAVPEDLDVETLKFVFNKQILPLKQK